MTDHYITHPSQVRRLRSRAFRYPEQKYDSRQYDGYTEPGANQMW